jgi:thioredoxin 1
MIFEDNMNRSWAVYVRRRIVLVVTGAAVLMGTLSFGQTPPADTPTDFAPLEQWKNAVLSGNAATLRAFYCSNPPTRVQANGILSSVDSDVDFWLGLKAQSIKVDVLRLRNHPDTKSITFRAVVQTESPNVRTVTVADSQAWQEQGGQWHLIGVERVDKPHLQQPSDMQKNIYPPEADAHAELKAAEERAAAEHKRVLLIFGANWCYDCHVLDLAFQRPELAPVLGAAYEVVHVDLGPDEHKNEDLVKEFDVPLDKGIPALAVAASDGKPIVSQKNGEFEDARSLTPEALLDFLNKWKPEAR